METLLIIILALSLDLAFGDPPTRFHPVGWMGKLISAIESLAPHKGKVAPFLYGALAVLLGTAVFTAPVYFLLDYLEETSRAAYIIAGALILKSTFSVRGLYRSASKVKKQLEAGDLKAARQQMPALVSRDTEELDDKLVVAATTESVAESSSDSYVAPLFWFLIFGVPGAIAYRMVNTFDSMTGYHGKYEYLGKFAARLDDVLNLIPARITALIIVFAALIGRQNGRAAWQIMSRDHSKTQSPNAGWPMSAAAGALGVQLEKTGHYTLGEARKKLSPRTISSMLSIMCLVAAIWGLLCLGIEGVKFALAS
ncbi:MAG: cobalamin biosynthesis protein [Dehalococcoidia bacterium]